MIKNKTLLVVSALTVFLLLPACTSEDNMQGLSLDTQFSITKTNSKVKTKKIDNTQNNTVIKTGIVKSG